MTRQDAVKWLNSKVGQHLDYDGKYGQWRVIDDPRVKAGYFVSDKGYVLSTLKKVHLMTSCLRRDGYRQVCLSTKKGTISLKVHRLVAKAFLYNPKDLPQVNHLDEDKSNNSVTNLEWCSAKDNNHYSKSAYYEKLNSRGVGSCAKLTDEDVRDIRLFSRKGIKTAQIASVYKITMSNVRQIVLRKTWRTV